jgi:limonene-1,2-epoxide hydrolase
MPMSNEDVIRAVLTAWGEGLEPAAAATREHFADDCVWEQTGLPTTTGPEEAAGFLLSMADMGFRGIEVEYRNVVAAGDVVCTERVDHIIKADGSRGGTFPVVGVTEFRDGKISAWREYFDSANLAQLA